MEERFGEYCHFEWSGCNGKCKDDMFSACGFCRFAKWIQERKLPKELKGYCKNVLNFLGQEVREFKADRYTDSDEEDDFYQEVQEFNEASAEEEGEGDYDDDEEEEDGEEDDEGGEE